MRSRMPLRSHEGLLEGRRGRQPCPTPPSGTRRATSAADLKFLHHLQQTLLGTSKSKSGTRIIELLVPLCFRSSCQSLLRCITNFGNGALAASKLLSVGL